MHCTAKPLSSITAEDYSSGLDVVFFLYNSARFKIKMIKAYGAFKTIMNHIKDTLDIDMNYSSAQEHFPDSERNYRTIQERFRAQNHMLLFRDI